MSRKSRVRSHSLLWYMKYHPYGFSTIDASISPQRGPISRIAISFAWSNEMMGRAECSSFVCMGAVRGGALFALLLHGSSAFNLPAELLPLLLRFRPADVER